MQYLDTRLPARFWAKTVLCSVTGCWLWTGASSRASGYGYVRMDDRNGIAHRYAYTKLVGEIPKGLNIDHLCRVRRCVNPAHLEPVTQRTNVMRGQGLCARNAVATHCKAGHAYDVANTHLTAEGWRQCRACHARRGCEHRASLKGLV